MKLNLKQRLGLEREMTSQNIINTDIYRYKRNKLASGLALLGLFIECLYFMLFYGINYSTYSNVLIGGTIILNLLILLSVFLASEGVKAYNKKFCIVLLVVGIIQIARIFIYPLDLIRGGETLFASTASESTVVLYHCRYFGVNLEMAEVGAVLIVYLVLSAACLLASALIGYIRAVQLEKFNKELADGAYTVEGALADLEAKDAAAAANGDVAVKEVENA